MKTEKAQNFEQGEEEFDENEEEIIDEDYEENSNQSSKQSRNNNNNKNDRDDRIDDDTNSSTNSPSAGLAAHIARVRAWRRDHRSLHSFIRAVTDDFIIPRELSQRIDFISNDKNYQSGLNDQYKENDLPLYELINYGALKYSVIARVLSETLKRAPALKSADSIIDASFGVGASAWAVNAALPNIKNYTAVELSNNHRVLGKQLTQHLPLTFKHLPRLLTAAEKENNSPTNKVKIVLSAFGILNLGRNQRHELLESMWNNLDDGGVMILIESGSHEGFESIRTSREFILDKYRTKIKETESSAPSNNSANNNHHNPLLPPLPSLPSQSSIILPGHATVLAPCGHDMICPQGKTGLCRFGQRTQTSSFPSSAPIKQIKSDDAIGGLTINYFSYVLLHKGPINTIGLNNKNNAEEKDFVLHRYNRIIRPSLIRSGHTIIDLCTTDAKIERRVIPKSAGLAGGYTQAKNSRWGDLWQFDRIISRTQKKKLAKLKRTKENENNFNENTNHEKKEKILEGEFKEINQKKLSKKQSTIRSSTPPAPTSAELKTGDSLEEFIKRRKEKLAAQKKTRPPADSAEKSAAKSDQSKIKTYQTENKERENVEEFDEEFNEEIEEEEEIELDRESERTMKNRRSSSSSPRDRRRPPSSSRRSARISNRR